MNKLIDLEVYKRISEFMGVGEIYLTHLPISINYTQAEYFATFTEAIPFNAFDKVICELLKAEEQLSLEEIGDILGLNVYTNENPKHYLDLAEKEILVEALQSLASEDFKMIDGGDIDFSKCRLLPIGREYAEQNCKFKTTENKPFTLYFDNTTGNHRNAKANYEFVNGLVSSTISSIEFTDEIALKEIALTQIPEIYNPEKQYSFTDAILQRKKGFVIEYPVGITYDAKLKRFHFYCYSLSEHKLLIDITNWLNQDEVTKKELTDKVCSQVSVDALINVDVLNKSIQQTANYTADSKISDFITELIKMEYADEYLFYSCFSELISSDEKVDLYISLPLVSDSIYQELTLTTQKAENEASRFFFVLPNEVDTKTQQLINQLKDISFKINNLYVIQEDVLSLSVYCKKQSGSFYIQLIDTSFVSADHFISKTLTHRKNWDNQADIDVNVLLTIISEKYVNKLCELAVQYVEQNIENEVHKKQIDELSYFELKLEPFNNIDISSDIISNTYELIEQARINWSLMLATSIAENLNQIEEELNLEPSESIFKEMLQRFKIIQAEINIDQLELKQRCEKINEIISIKQSAFEESRKVFSLILDTGVYLKDPMIITRIDKKNKIVLPDKVLNELNGFKKIQQLKEIATKCITELHANKNKNIHRVQANLKHLPKEFSKKTPDNLMLSVASMYKDHNGILVSDVNELIDKAQELGIPLMSSEAFIEKFVNFIKK